MSAQLTDKQFVTKNGNLTLLSKNAGPILVYFYSTGCQGCSVFRPHWADVISSDFKRTFAFAEINLERHSKVVGVSRNSKTPIPYTPYLMLFINNEPYAVYKGTMNATSVSSFLKKIIEKLSGHSGDAPGSTSYGGPSIYTQSSDLVQLAKRPMGNRTGYAVMGGGDEEDSSKLMCPTNLIPHNCPWSSEYRKMGAD